MENKVRIATHGRKPTKIVVCETVEECIYPVWICIHPGHSLGLGEPWFDYGTDSMNPVH